MSSALVFAGSMQFVMIDFIAEQTPYYMVALMTVVINARYAVYGLSLMSIIRTFHGIRNGI